MPESFQFINISDSSQQEKKWNRKLARSHLQSQYHRKHLVKSRQTKKRKFSDQEVSGLSAINVHADIGDNDQRRAPLKPSDPASAEVVLPLSPRTSSSGGHSFSPRTSSMGGHSIGSTRVISQIDEGAFDPFGSRYMDVPMPVVSELMDYNIGHLWPSLRPLHSKDKRGIETMQFMRKVMSSQLLFNAALFSASFHLNSILGPGTGGIRFKSCLSIKSTTLRLLADELREPSQPPSDATLAAILALAAHNSNTTVCETGMPLALPVDDTQPPFRQVLTKLQRLDIYGKITFVKEHMDAMIDMTKSRGGLDNLQSEALAELISAADIIEASRNLMKPRLARPRRIARFPISSLGADQVFCSYQDIGQTFQSPSVQDILSSNFLHVLAEMTKYTTIASGYIQGNVSNIDMSALAGWRNGIQHELLSLPSREHFDVHANPDANVDLQELIRVASLIYSAGVIMPLPNSSGVLKRLSQQLKAVAIDLDAAAVREPRILVWSLVLGGIAAERGVDRDFFVITLSSLLQEMGILDWTSVHQLLRSCLWQDMVLDLSARVLWGDIGETLGL